MLPSGRFHPFELDTFGLGKVLQAVVKKGARRCFLGIGGSATNDGGFGVAKALGWQFLDAARGSIERWTELWRLAKVFPPQKRLWCKRLIVAVDVQNPLPGSRGATRIYGPQKGLRPDDFPRAERALRRLSRTSPEIARQSGAGAAGGLGFGLAAFFGASLCSGFEIFSEQARLDNHLQDADLVITGEGQIDVSTLMGKAVGQVTRRCRRFRIPSVVLAGTVVGGPRVRNAFTTVNALTDLVSRKKALTEPARWLETLAQRAASSHR